MKKTTRFTLLSLSFLFVFSLTTFAKGYKIKVQLKSIKDTSVILAHYFGKAIYPDDTAYLDKNGVGYFEGDEALIGGLYIVYLPDRTYFEFLLDKNQQFTIINDTADYLENMQIEGDPMNQAFIDYQKHIQVKRKEREAIDKELKDTTISESKKEKLKEKLEKLTDEVDEYQKQVIADNKDNFLGTFLNMLTQIEVPDPPKDDEGNIIDSAFQYKYYKSHFFDNFDYTDPRLLRTPLYESKLQEYYTRVIPQVPDTIIKELDIILDRSMPIEEIFRFNLIKVFNHYAKSNIMGMDAVYIHLAEKYYIPHASWSDSTFIEKLKGIVKENKPTLIGNIAPDVEMIWVPKEHFLEAAQDTAKKNFVHVGRKLYLSQIPGDYFILAFWEKDCGHCKKTIPQLYKFYKDTLQELGVQVISFHMLFGKEGKVKWIDFVNEHELWDWINVWNPYSYQFKIDYNIKSTPQLFVLDKNKKIISKKIGAEQSRDIILHMIEIDKRKKEKEKEK